MHLKIFQACNKFPLLFLLLVFFMLASRFGSDALVPLSLGGSGDTYSGPPRLIDVLPEGQRLNGQEQSLEMVIAALDDLTESRTEMVVLRARDGAALQRMVTVMSALRAAGFTAIAVVD